MPPTNKAAFYPSDKAPLLSVAPAPYPTAGPGEVVIRVAAAAINPIDHKVQDLGTSILPWLTYPLAGGLDLAGTIVAVGPGVSADRALAPGDRVLAFALEFASRAGAFQRYAVASASAVSRIPDAVSFVDAAVLPSGFATAAVALYQYLGLAAPPAPPSAPAPRTGRTVLIAGGASSVGSNAIQLAVASGYDVITTCSVHNTAHCASLGASRVFDYHSPSVAADLKAALSGADLAGAISCVEESNALVFDVVSSSSEGSKSVACTILFSEEGVPANVRTEMIHAHWIKDTPLAAAVFGAFLPAALATGAYKCEPKARVVGHGLEAVQAAFDIGKMYTLSCEKLVVTLESEA
ncbi:GroES-like protein [Hypoxylon argillaceum]|nr:GroES-like protein [Hypoxylon argillaceum]